MYPQQPGFGQGMMPSQPYAGFPPGQMQPGMMNPAMYAHMGGKKGKKMKIDKMLILNLKFAIKHVFGVDYTTPKDIKGAPIGVLPGMMGSISSSFHTHMQTKMYGNKHMQKQKNKTFKAGAQMFFMMFPQMRMTALPQLQSFVEANRGQVAMMFGIDPASKPGAVRMAGMGHMPMMGQPMMGQPMMGQPMPGQPMMGQPMPGQPMPGQPMPGQPMPGQPMPGQPMPGQPMPGQPMMGQPMPGAYPPGPAAYSPYSPGAAAPGYPAPTPFSTGAAPPPN